MATDASSGSKFNAKADASNPLFIHHSDHPAMMLVSKPLNGDNYSTWSRAMKISLSAKNKLGFVDGTMKSLWDELSSYSESVSCTCGAQNERNKLMQFLMGLNDSYSVVRGQLLLMNPLPTVRQAYASISQEEKQRSLAYSRVTTDVTAMTVRQPSSKSSNRKPLHCTH
ncbi:hypothetical protein D8674_007698 [Pyrus ussuriensis x Pyrus communis]|uniref:Retrotransposon Copia-like N-terminal domain-containing protein n=1 Tax=Pyrus ussuriensis x Pyrus communis TaxID=2448454 RepID=A0A5N5HQP5_9ROSA|nr:hypothetical protein D8674_007698 [Pyrus ussuriensis x Pyrus communis]